MTIWTAIDRYGLAVVEVLLLTWFILYRVWPFIVQQVAVHQQVVFDQIGIAQAQLATATEKFLEQIALRDEQTERIIRYLERIEARILGGK